VNVCRLLPLFAALLLAASSFADSLRIATWNLEWFPTRSPSAQRDPVAEGAYIAEAAAILRELDADVALLQEIRDLESAEKLVEAIGQEGWNVAIVSRFRQGNAIGRQQVAIASRLPARAAFAEPWQPDGLLSPPRGFAFALFEIEGFRLATYSVHLKSNVPARGAERDWSWQTNILSREISARQLLAHLEDLERLLGTPVDAVVVGGDFNTTPDQEAFFSEETLEIFTRAGFANPLLELPPAERVTIPPKGSYPPATFDYLLVRGLVPSGPARVHPTDLSDHRPVIVELALP
jgi:endonuclease/exonuclease/phosphatase family metal-dependent hydrolase